MILRAFLALLALTLPLAFPPVAPAAEAPAPAAEQENKAGGLPGPMVTRHSLTLADRTLDYTTTVEFLPLRDGRQQDTARLFTVSYLLGGQTTASRPVAFIFNGGPGAASAYLHLGAAGPRALVFAPDGGAPPPPARLADNPDTWLRFADLVFIDPVGTGFSFGIKDGKPDPESEKAFWKADADARALAQAVRLWLARNQRWGSPVVLAGESYGGFRVALMAAELVREVGVAPSGLVMISPVIDFHSQGGGEMDVLPWAFRLPPFAAAAAFHGRGAASVAEAEAFAFSAYPAGLIARRATAPAAASAPFNAALAGFTGLPEALIARHGGRVPAGVFARELLRDQGRVLSIYDGVLSAPDPDPAATGIRQDPFLGATTPAFTTAFSVYLADELGWHSELPYALLSGRVNAGWSWTDDERSVLARLRDLLALLPTLRLLIAHGRTDLVTPYPASCWLADHFGPLPGRDCASTVRVYDGGHMMYSHSASRQALTRDLAALFDGIAP